MESLRENDFLDFDILLLLEEFGAGHVVSARVLAQLSDPEHFVPCGRRSSGDGRDFRQLAGLLEHLVDGADSLDQPRAVLVCRPVFDRRCLDAIVASELAHSVV